MSLEDAYFISQIVAAVAIVASLLFVAIQLRQSERTQRAAMHQARAERVIGFYARLSDMAPLMTKASRSPETLTAEETWQLRSVVMMTVLNLEDQLWQREHGLLEAASVERTRAAARRILSVPAIRAAWRMQKPVILAGQAEIFEREVIAGQPLAPDVDANTAWQAALAGVRAEASPRV